MRSRLSDRQREIVSLIAEGLNTDEIAERLGISRWTVKDHVAVLCQRFACPMRELPAAVESATSAKE